MEEDLKNVEEFFSKRTLDEIDKFLFDKYIKSMEKVLDAYRQDEKMIDEMASALYDYANLEVLIKCPAEYDGKYNLDLCKMNLADRNCCVCIKEYFRKKVENDG